MACSAQCCETLTPLTGVVAALVDKRPAARPTHDKQHLLAAWVPHQNRAVAATAGSEEHVLGVLPAARPRAFDT